MTLDEKQALCEAEVTLNGDRARVSGAQLRFARVTQLESGLGAEWAWETVAHIVNNKEGRFRS